MGLIPQWLRIKKETEIAVEQTPFDLDFNLLKWSPSDGFTWRDAFEGVAILGAPGSGKSSGPGRALRRALLASGAGMVVGCLKPDERSVWEKDAAAMGRSDSLLIVRPGGEYRCNLLAYAHKLGVEHVVDMLTVVGDIAERGDKRGGGKGDSFFRQTNQRVIRHAALICGAAKGTISMSLLNDIITTAPRTHDEVQSEQWQATSACYHLIKEGDERSKTGAEERDFARRQGSSSRISAISLLRRGGRPSQLSA